MALTPRATRIIATLGPATDDEQVLSAMIAAGVDVVRLNFSHGTQQEHALRVRMVRRVAERLERVVAVMQDLQGPKVRIGRLRGGAAELVAGRTVRIVPGEGTGSAARLMTPYAGLAGDVRPGDRVLLDDGRIELRVRDVRGDTVTCIVVAGGAVREGSGMNLPGVRISAPPLTAKDEADLRFGLEAGVDMVALSFVRAAGDAAVLRRAMGARGRRVPVIAKVEKADAVERVAAVLRSFDGVMVARGDLGAELGPERVPVAQRRIIAAARAAGRPAIIATQMLESMIHAPLPTRAEASDVANAVFEGADAVMLSGETAIGDHPVRVVEAMARIVREAEAATDEPPWQPQAAGPQAQAVCRAAVRLAEEIGGAAIAAYTRTGNTARTLSALRPRVPVYALCGEEAVARRLSLLRGVTALVSPPEGGVVRALVARGIVGDGERVVVVGASPGRARTETDFVRVEMA